MILGESSPQRQKQMGLQFFQETRRENVLNNETFNNNSDEILKNYLMKKKEKYATDCPLCQSRVMPFKIEFQNIIFICINQKVIIK